MYGTLVVTAWRGRGAQALDFISVGFNEATRRGEGRAVTLAAYATAVLANALGDYNTALDAARRASEHDDLDLCGWALIELIEAATRSGRPELAGDAMSRLNERTRGSATDWGLGTAARSRAVLSDARDADSLYQEAIERLARTRIAVDLARAHLMYGEWLRREARRVDARAQLRRAYAMFTHMGAEAFAERARRELVATGETVRKRSVQTRNELTAQESQVAQLARDGHTNPEIAAELFISSRTVEWHLGKVFTKLDIGSRRELRRVLPDRGRAGTSA
jgi:DNA-binding CsgD family transcriptional regulator